MPYQVRTNAFHSDVVEWLQENVGNLLWSRPIVEWRGQGWTMNHFGSLDSGYRYLIRIDDAELATICALKWSG